MKAKATLVRTYIKEVTVEFDYELGLDPIREAADQVLYTQEVEKMFETARLKEVDDIVDSVTWEEGFGTKKRTMKEIF